MKTIIALLISICSYGQTIGIWQDIKLAVQTDDYGNSPYTADLTGKIGWERMPNIHNVYIYHQVEWANLAGGNYTRLGIVGVKRDFYLLNELIALSPEVNYGIISRWQDNFASLEVGLDGSVRLYKNLFASLLWTYTERSDVEVWRQNLAFGLKIQN